MKILYVVDLHGYPKRFERVFQAAIDHGVEAVISGGDNFSDLFVAPWDKAIEAQKNLFTKFLPGHLKKYEDAKIHWACILSMHDLEIFDQQFTALCKKSKYFHNCQNQIAKIGGYEFVGTGNVVDIPFPPKNRCRRDTKSCKMDQQFGQPIGITEQGWVPIKDWEKQLMSLPTLLEDLLALPETNELQKSVYIIHHPPKGLGLGSIFLDVDKAPINGDLSKRQEKEIGSEAVYSFLKDHQPLLALHGHVHESPRVTGKWRGEIGNTVCIQPGQNENKDKTHFMIIDLPSLKMERFLE